MTFEEAKKRIKECVKLCTEDYNRYEDEFMRGEAAAYKNALAIFNGIDTDHELSRLTLEDLAHELRKLFRFKYLTCEFYGGSKVYVISLWNGEPRWRGGAWWWCDNCDLITDIKLYMKFAKPNLSEYRDADGNIDYSKCIVEVER